MITQRMTRAPQTRRIPIPEDLCRALEGQRERLRKKFGRDPGPEDPVFFDPDAPAPRPPRTCAFSKADVAEWQAALDEYDALTSRRN